MTSYATASSSSRSTRPDDFRARRRSWLRSAARSRGLRWIGYTVALAGAAYLGLRFAGGLDPLVTRFGAAAIVLLLPLQTLLALSPIPSQIAAIPIVLFFGFWAGAALIWLGWFATAALQFLLLRRAAIDLDFTSARARLPRRLRNLPAGHPAFLVLVRWIPGGSHLVNGAAAAYGVSLQRHLAFAALSILPRAVFFATVVSGLRLL